MSNHLTPLQVLERAFGSLERASEGVGLHPKTAYAWRHASKNRDAGDIPSVRLIRSLLLHARQNGIPLEHRHLIDGAPEGEIEDLLKRVDLRAIGSQVAAE